MSSFPLQSCQGLGLGMLPVSRWPLPVQDPWDAHCPASSSELVQYKHIPVWEILPLWHLSLLLWGSRGHCAAPAQLWGCQFRPDTSSILPASCRNCAGTLGVCGLREPNASSPPGSIWTQKHTQCPWLLEPLMLSGPSLPKPSTRYRGNPFLKLTPVSKLPLLLFG